MKRASILTKTALLASIILCGVSANAQTEKGHWSVSGNLGMSFTANNNRYENAGEYRGTIKNNSFNLKGGIEYFVIDNLSVGVSMTFANSNNKTTESDGTVSHDSKTSGIAIGPSATYYFTIPGKLRPFIGAGAGYIMEDYGNDDRFSGLYYGGAAGATYFFNQTIGATLQMNYNQMKMSRDDNKDIKMMGKQFYPTLGFSLFF